jgi:hypothetical protein
MASSSGHIAEQPHLNNASASIASNSPAAIPLLIRYTTVLAPPNHVLISLQPADIPQLLSQISMQLSDLQESLTTLKSAIAEI